MRTLLAITCVLCLAGCAKERSLVGTWTTKNSDQTGTMVFRPNGTFHSEAESRLYSLTLDGTYEYKGENLRQHISTWQVGKQKLKPEDLAEMNKLFAKDIIATVSWVDNDQVRISSDGSFVVATRQSK